MQGYHNLNHDLNANPISNLKFHLSSLIHTFGVLHLQHQPPSRPLFVARRLVSFTAGPLREVGPAVPTATFLRGLRWCLRVALPSDFVASLVDLVS